MDFIFTYHQGWLIVISIIAFGYAFFLYRKERLLDEVSKPLRWLMAGLRFLGSWLLLLLLLGIVLERNMERKEKPLIFMANDNTASIVLNKDSTFYKTTFPQAFKESEQKLAEKFEVVSYSFSDRISSDFNFDYSGKSTNISNVFSEIYSQYPNRNVGGIILASDGIYNEGLNPIYKISEKNYIPVFTVGLGDTSELKDVRIDFVEHNNIAFFGNQFPVDVLVSNNKCGGERVNVSILEGDKVIASQEIVMESDGQQVRLNFILKANSIGFKKYTARVTKLSDEFSYQNNEANFYIEVIDGRQKLLIVSDEPHPDVAALRYVIDNNKNYEVAYKRTDEVSDVAGYDLVVLHNYKSKNNAIEKAMAEGRCPFLVVAGIGGNTRLLTEMNIGISGSASSAEDLNMAFNPNFKEIILSPEIKQTFSSAPPLTSPFGNFGFSNAIDVMAFQKIGSIELTKPLIYFTKKSGARFGVIMGEGFWRWRLYDQARNSSTANFEELFTKIIAYLALKENKDPFRVFVESEFKENEEVTLKAELYNKSFELVNEPEVQLVYSNEDEKEFNSSFIATSESYQLDLGNLPAGIYKWRANTSYLGVNYKKEGTFLVNEIKLEWLSGKADHRLLKTLSENTNGAFYLPSEMDKLTIDVLTREDLVTVVYQEKSFDDLIDYKWIFILIVGLISLEWIMRKYNGAY